MVFIRELCIEDSVPKRYRKNKMVRLATPNLSTKNFPYEEDGTFEVISSGTTEFPSGDTLPYLTVVPEGEGTRFQFALNWTNQSKIAQLGYSDTEDLHGKFIHVQIEDVTFMNKEVQGLRITAVIEQEAL